MNQIEQTQGRAFVELTLLFTIHEAEVLISNFEKDQRANQLAIPIMESFNLSPKEVSWSSTTGPSFSDEDGWLDEYTTTYEVDYSQLVSGTVWQDVGKKLNEFLSITVGTNEDYHIFICDQNDATWRLEC